MATTANTQTLTGVLERIIFLNEENAYCVAEVAVVTGKQPITRARQPARSTVARH